MKTIRAWIVRSRQFVTPARSDRDFDEELESHLQLHIDDNLRAGMTPADARRAALLALGGIDQTKERHRDRRGLRLAGDLVADIRYGLRALRRNAGFTTVAAGTLAVGIGATTAVFSLFNAVIIRPLPIADAGRLVYVRIANPHMAGLPVDLAPSNADFLDLEREARSFSSMAAVSASPFTLVAGGNAERIRGAKVSGAFFQTLNVAPRLGRAISPADDSPDSPRVAIISDRMWRTHFLAASDVLAASDALGTSITLDRQQYRIVGVMPAAFQYPRESDLGSDAPGAPDIWVPFALTSAQKGERDFSNNDALIARLRPGVPERQAGAEVAALFTPLDALHSKEWRGWRASLAPFVSVGPSRLSRAMWLLLGAISLVLLIACSNAAHLVLARAAGRSHEIGVRSALGATRGRIIRQLVTEALLLTGAGGALGVGVAAVALALLPRLDPGNIPRFDQTSLDVRVLLFSVAISLLAGLLVGLLPALALSRLNTLDLIKRGGAGRTTDAAVRPREILITAEIALAFVLLTTASLFVRSYLKVLDVDRGFSPSTLTMRISLDGRYSQANQRRDFFQAVLSEIRRMPGVGAAGGVSALPLSHSESMSIVTAEGHADHGKQFVNTRQVTAGYFSAMGTRLIAGRALDEGDVEGRAPAVVVNEAFANTYFRNENALGKHVCLCFIVFGDKNIPDWPAIVGVVGNVRHSNLEDAPSPEVYSSFLQGEPSDSLYLSIRTQAAPSAVLPQIRSIVNERDPGLAVADARVMDERASESSASRRFQTVSFTAFAAIAIALAGVGLYGLLAYAARQRAPEFAIRIALGADGRDILTLVLGEAMKLLAAGLTLGLAGSLVATQLLPSLLFEVAPRDPTVLVVVAFVLLATAVLASWLPARRATRVDPLMALRAE